MTRRWPSVQRVKSSRSATISCVCVSLLIESSPFFFHGIVLSQPMCSLKVDAWVGALWCARTGRLATHRLVVINSSFVRQVSLKWALYWIYDTNTTLRCIASPANKRRHGLIFALIFRATFNHRWRRDCRVPHFLVRPPPNEIKMKSVWLLLVIWLLKTTSSCYVESNGETNSVTSLFPPLIRLGRWLRVESFW